MSCAVPPGGCGIPSRSHIVWKLSRSSARSMDAGLVPSTGIPASSNECASFSGVWPPSDTITPAMRPSPVAWRVSASQIAHTPSTVRGSKNRRSLVS